LRTADSEKNHLGKTREKIVEVSLFGLGGFVLKTIGLKDPKPAIFLRSYESGPAKIPVKHINFWP
jgi:hypothetical protein